MIPTIKALNEWSILHNATIKPLNKPKRVYYGLTGFCMSNEERALKRLYGGSE